jgi:hypothetical protein
MGRKLVQDKLRHCHRVRRSSLGSHFSKAGKGESGDNPKPKPHPIDPGKMSYEYSAISIVANLLQAKVDRCLRE